MKVLVTGGTGFIGSHVARAAAAAGHRVRLLARDPSKVKTIFPPNGSLVTEIAPGDMRDPAAVAAAVSGCDAVIHCAAEIGVAGGAGQLSTGQLSTGQSGTGQSGTGGPGGGTANAEGAGTVFEAALAAGRIPVIYTSTVVAHLPSDDPVLTAGSPLAEPLSAYGASKRDAELLAARLRADGAPVLSVALGGVYGPGSPRLDGGSVSIIAALESMMLAPPGGVGVIDVRDVAELLTRLLDGGLLDGGRAPGRIMAGGRFVTWPEWTRVLGAASGIHVPFQEVSADDMVALGREMDSRRAAGAEVPPLSEEAAIIMAAGRPTDDGEALRVLSRDYRPTADTFRDTVAYLRRTGRLPS